MKIHTYEVSEDTIKKIEARMQEKPFTCMQLTCFAHDQCGVPYQTSDNRHGMTGCAERLADRLIQWHRKRGHISRKKQEWSWNT